MNWQADDDWPGGTPGRDAAPPELLAAFAHGGAWGSAAPSAALAVALEHAAGPAGLFDGADADALVGIVRQWAAVESWAAAGMMAALRAMMREDNAGSPALRRRTDLPSGWDDSLNYEIAAALAMGPVSAQYLAQLAWALGMRLPGIGRLLADGTLTKSKARRIAQLFEPLSDDDAARAEALILGDLAGKTYLQVERLAWRAALAVAPDAAERSRKRAERQARVTVFRDEAGTAALSGRDLPAAEALTGHANVVARARLYAASGVFPGESTSRLEAQAYLDLLSGIPAADRIAFAATASPDPPDDPSPDDDDGTADDDWPGGSDPGPPAGNTAADDDDELLEPDDEGRDGDGGDGPGEAEVPEAPVPLADVTVPLATLQGRAERAGDNRLLGPLDPALARQLAAAAARSPHSRWEIIIVDEHGIARPARGTRPPPQPPPGPARAALPARISITVTEILLRQLTQAAEPRPGAPPEQWDLRPKKPGSWALTLPGGPRLAVRFDVVPTHDCDHRHQTSAYQPGERLRRLVQVRDYQCTFPTCSRPARESDFEHAVPYDKGGKTDACNAGARSRRCHQVKQSPSWTVTQPKPGWHQWTTPTGRTYTQEPWHYTA